MYQALNMDGISESLRSHSNDAQSMFYAGYLFSKFNLIQKKDVLKLFDLLKNFRNMKITHQEWLRVLENLFQVKVERFEFDQIELILQTFINHFIPKFEFQPQHDQKKNPSTIKKLSSKECSICFERIDFKEITILGCSHEFHRLCVLKVIETRIDEGLLPILCPFGQCRKQISQKYFSRLLSQQYDKKYQKLFLQRLVERNYESMSWCPTVGCKHVFRFQPSEIALKCPVCMIKYCVKCRVQFHEDMTCDDYLKDQKFIQFAQEVRYKQCRRCKYWVEKSQGCDHMTCRCHFEFCYLCGKNYGGCICQNQVRMRQNQELLRVRQQQPPLIRREPYYMLQERVNRLRSEGVRIDEDRFVSNQRNGNDALENEMQQIVEKHIENEVSVELKNWSFSSVNHPRKLFRQMSSSRIFTKDSPNQQNNMNIINISSATTQKSLSDSTTG